jgi:NAD(P)-dependent dehydrogenase (short-subunit alcohol dehydrogenase family)
MGHWTSDNIEDQSGRIAIVTGSNSGIGFEAAKALATKGATVVMAVRSETKGRTAAEAIRSAGAPGSVQVAALDLADLASVRAFADAFKSDHDRLDLLINNAGVMMPPKSQTTDGFELQFGTNHLGHFALTAQLADLLTATPGSRVVNVASMAHRFGTIDFDDLQWETRRYSKGASYGQSKLANLLFTFELQRRLDAAGAGTLAVAAHPGWTATNLQRHTGAGNLLNPVFGMSPWQGALPTLYAATAPEAEAGSYYGPKGLLEMRGFPGKVGSTAESRDEHKARRLWEVSEDLTGARFELPSA